MYASKTLTLAEKGNFNIEEELLGVVLSLERLHHYVFGSKIKVQADHKPPIPIWKKSILVARCCLLWLLIRLAKYDVELTCLKGKDNVVADTLS